MKGVSVVASRILSKNEVDSRFSEYRCLWLKAITERGFQIALIESQSFVKASLTDNIVYSICQSKIAGLIPKAHLSQIVIHAYVDNRELQDGKLYVAFEIVPLPTLKKP